MMTTIRRAVSRTLVATALGLGGVSCSNDFLQVTNPDVIDAAEVDPTATAAALAASAQQNFAMAVGTFIQFSSHFTGETYIMETSGAQNEFGRREVSDLNGQATVQWRDMSLAVASAKLLLDLTLPNPTTNVHIARAATFRAGAMFSPSAPIRRRLNSRCRILASARCSRMRAERRFISITATTTHSTNRRATTPMHLKSIGLRSAATSIRRCARKHFRM